MKTRNCIVLLALVAMVLSACRTDVDMRKADTTIRLDMGLALPIGSMKMTLGSILGATPIAGSFCYDENGTLVFRDTFLIRKAFHPVDITEKGTDTELKHLHLTDYYENGWNEFDNTRVRLTYNIGMKLRDVNDSLDYERFDAVQIREAEFISLVNYRKDYGQRSEIQSDWIEKIDMILGDQFTREAGKTITLYDRDNPVEGQQQLVYGEEFRMHIDEFTMSLQKDPSLVGDSTVYNHNVTDSIFFKIRIQLRIPEGSLYFDDNSAFEYDMKLGMLKYRAVWGMFSPSNDMRDNGIFRIAESWDTWSKLDQMRLPLTDPEIQLNCVTQVAGHLMLRGDYLYVKDEKSNDSVFATFNGHKNLEMIFKDEECLDVNSPIGDSTTIKIHFSKDPSEGCLDKLFAIHPSVIGYDFEVDFADKLHQPLARITDNTDISIHAILRAPFSFNRGVLLQYGDTVRDLDLSPVSKDSLYKHVTWLDSLRAGKVTLALVGENTLPMSVDGELLFLDEYGKRVMTRNETGDWVPFRITKNQSDTVHFDAPKFRANGTIEEPGRADLSMVMTDEQLDALSKVKSIQYNVLADDKAIQALQDANPGAEFYPLTINNQSALKLRIGLAASVDALLDFKNGKEK